MKRTIYILFLLVLSTSAAIAEKGHGPRDKCGTFSNDRVKDGIFIQVTRPTKQHTYISEPGNFAIHYDLQGQDAVDIIDTDQNGVPDYVDSVAYYFEYVHDLYVNQLGYHAPFDFDSGGTSQYDIYIEELGTTQGYYGLTSYDTFIEPKKKFSRYTTYIEIDNNFSPRDSIFDGGKKYKTYYIDEYDALKVTAAHEYFHAIQFIYGNIPQLGLFAEMASTSMEIRLFPELTDYHQYVNDLLRNINIRYFGNYDMSQGYQFGIFGEYLYKKFGDAPMKRTWEIFEDGVYHFKALDSALQEQGSDLASEWCEFSTWLYYTGERAVDGQYLNFADQFPLLNMAEADYEYPAFNNSQDLQPLEIYPQRIIFPSQEKTADTVDIIIVNTDFSTAGYSNRNSQMTTVIFSENNGSGIPVEGTKYYYSVNGQYDKVCSNLWIYPGTVEKFVDQAFPNPFNPDKSEGLFIPAPQGASISTEAKFSILTTAGEEIFYSGNIKLTNKNGIVAALWNNVPTDLEPGVYLYLMETNRGKSFGKFALIRKN